MEKCVGKGKVSGALLTDLPKVFDCLKCLTDNSYAYSFNLLALRLIHNYLSNTKQSRKIENTYSNWMEIGFAVTQVSILRPI